MKMRKFTDFETPPVTVMIQEATLSAVVGVVEKTKKLGAEAFCLIINELEEKYRTANAYKEIFDAMGNCPCYIANYTMNLNEGKSDEYCLSQALVALECGAALFDVPGDAFCKSENEITYNETAIKKQTELIDYVHSMGKEVIMSSHTNKFLKSDDVLAIAKEHIKRGADIAKIVTNADTAEELTENYKISVLLKQKLSYPHLFLCNGLECRRHRLLSPILGSCMNLCLPSQDLAKSQPSINKTMEFMHQFDALNERF